ncbi:ABC transporter ATP-binding protein [Ureibacillus thermophilus]|uniref:ABC transporter ATP-binding protein n=1 Tax=Ureibacillus thermophilus TaxID=367743 RepID=A0A4P6USM6_9BACL|nr:ABC transporter ATP-binding protein [Ureibacillus thermophilus]QBK25006.1 ABC transporter ATP-binding protein [Ureibacillus thermophilus]
MHAVLKLSKYLKPYKHFAVLAPILMILEVAMDLVQPTIMQKIIDDGIVMNNTLYIVGMFIVMIACAIIGWLGGAGCNFFSSKAAVNFAADIRADLYETITYFSNSNKDKFTLGKLITNLTNDVEMLQRALNMLLKVFVRGPFMFIGAVLVVFFTARDLFPILFFVVPVLIICLYVFIKLSITLFRKVQEAIDGVNTRVQENLSGIRVIKAFNRMRHQVKQFTGVNEELTKRNMTADQVIAALMPITQFVVNIGIVLALMLGVVKVEAGANEIGVIVAFINYLMMIMNGLMSSSNVLIQIARAIPSAERVVVVLEEQPDITNAENPVKKEILGDVNFEHVSFSYNKQVEPVLKDISFEAKAGSTVGIIGMTGSGKSTLIKLLARLMDVDEGTIYIDGFPIQQYDIETLRNAMAFAPQKATLFSTTIEENLKYGKSDATKEEIKEALVASNAIEFVEKLDKKEQHELTQGATNLSGGQKQRLAMSRALIRKPKILVLDDTTSAVDSITEKMIQKNMKELKGSTKFIVSSKISSIQHANLILVLEDGRIVAKGTHEELLKTSEHYREIVATQVEKGGILHE